MLVFDVQLTVYQALAFLKRQIATTAKTSCTFRGSPGSVKSKCCLTVAQSASPHLTSTACPGLHYITSAPDRKTGITRTIPKRIASAGTTLSASETTLHLHSTFQIPVTVRCQIYLSAHGRKRKLFLRTSAAVQHVGGEYEDGVR